MVLSVRIVNFRTCVALYLRSIGTKMRQSVTAKSTQGLPRRANLRVWSFRGLNKLAGVFFFICTALLLVPSQSYGQAQCVTVQDGDWNNSNVWEEDTDRDGSPNGTACPSPGYPDSGDDAIIDENHRVFLRNDMTSSSGEGAISSLTINADNGQPTGIAFDGFSLEVSGSVTNNSASVGLDLDNSLLNGGDLTTGDLINSGDISAGSRSLTVNGILTNNSSGEITASSGGSVSVSNSVVATQDAVLNDGTINIGDGTFSVTNSNEAPVENNGTISSTGSGTIDMDTAFKNNSGATLNIGSGTLNIAISISNSGTFTSTSGSAGGTVVFDGSGLTAITGTFSGSANSFANVTVKAGAIPNPDGTINVGSDGNFTVENLGQWGEDGEDSSLIYTGLDFSISGTFNAASLSIEAGTASSSTTPVKTTGEVFADVFISSKDTYAQVSNDFIINGKLTVTSQTTLEVEEGSGSLTLNDDFEMNGTFIAGEQATEFKGQTAGNSSSTEPGVAGPDGSPGPCASDGGKATSDGDCEQDIVGTGGVQFGPVEIDLDDTRVTLSTNDQNQQSAKISDLTIDPGDDNTGVEFLLADADLTLTGNLVSNGFFDAGGKRVTFLSGSEQTIEAAEPVEFFQATINNSSSAGVKIKSDTDIIVEEQLEIADGVLSFFDASVTNASLTIENELFLEGGDVDGTNGPVVLKSAGTTEAYVRYDDDDGTSGLDGEIIGNVTIQRELQTGPAWYMMSAVGASSNDSFSGFLESSSDPNANDLWTQGIPGSDGENASASNIRFYDQSVNAQDDDDRYVPITSDASVSSMTDAIPSGKGFVVYVFSDDNFDGSTSIEEDFEKLIDSVVDPSASKSFDFGAQSTVNLAGIDGDNDGFDSDMSDPVDPEDGWILLGNPYLAAIDWDVLQAQPSTSNIDGTVYVYSPASDGYVTWDGSSGNLTDGHIAPMQGFFVKASSEDADGSSTGFQVEDITAAQANASDTFFKSSPQSESRSINLAVEADGIQRDAFVSFQDGGEIGKDRLDSYALAASPNGGNGVLSMYSVLDGIGYTAQSLPFNLEDAGQEVTMPIEVAANGCVNGSPWSTTATITWPELRNIPSYYNLVLTDTETGQQIDLRRDSQYSFELTANTTCSSLTASKSGSEGQQLPPPAPSVIRHDMSKSGDGQPRFRLTINPLGLPVEIGSFTGSADGDASAILEWTTLSETSNSGFFIQQKVDGSFKTVSSLIEGAGTTTEKQSYRFRAEDLEQGTTHTFRLRQMDVDGAESFSETVDIQIGIGEAYTLEAYPNPITSRQTPTVRFAVEKSQPVTVEVYNTLGQRVRTLYNDTPRTTGQFISLDLDAVSLSSGVYFIRMQGESFTTTEKLVVVR